MPSAIEPNGAMLVLSEPQLSILQASSNIGNFVGVAPESLLGAHLGALFSELDVCRLASGIIGDGKRQYISGLRVVNGTAALDALVHRYKGLLIVELEPAQIVSGQNIFGSLTNAMAELDGPRSLSELCQRVAICIRRITGFDRVMVYRFLKDETGEVIAEDSREDLVPYFGLRYPASDIPAQARRLYLLNSLRLKADVTATSAALIPALNPFTGAPLDMTFCVLRSMSPVHVEYLRNMGVAASMSISIVKDGMLWGLIACHHGVAKLIPHPIRITCEVLARVFSSHIAAAEDKDQRAHATALRVVNTHIQENMRRLRNAFSALSESSEEATAAIGAHGCVISIGGKLALFGTTPNRSQVESLLIQLGIHQNEHVFNTEQMCATFPSTAEFATISSGLLSLRIALSGPDFVLWFRPPIIQIIRWAGNPAKTVEETENGTRISPRLSFEQWKQTLGDRCEPWTDAVRDFASVLRPAITATLLLQLNEEIFRLNEELARSNLELNAFAHTASHDLQEPVRTIRIYAQIVALRSSLELSPESRSYISMIEQSAERMGRLIAGLLSYSTVGGTEGRPDTLVNLEEVLRWSLTNLAAVVQDSGAVVTHDALPVVFSDYDHMLQLFQNLLTNAIKYRKPNTSPRIHLSSRLEGGNFLLSVSDDGEGFEPDQAQIIFGPFKRLHGKEVPGNGIGLSTCKRIMDRHKGRIWAESKGKNLGATFWFTLPNPSEQAK